MHKVANWAWRALLAHKLFTPHTWMVIHTQARLLSLLAAQQDWRLALLQLGHLHHLGEQGLPPDAALAYAYYSNIAAQTAVDRQNPSAKQVGPCLWNYLCGRSLRSISVFGSNSFINSWDCGLFQQDFFLPKTVLEIFMEKYLSFLNYL